MENKKEISIVENSSASQICNRSNMYSLFKANKLPETEILQNLGLFIDRQTLSRLLFMNKLYTRILNVHGSIIEFGVRWGQNMSLFSNLRGMYEPFNHSRKIYGFDTFAGFPNIDEKDGEKAKISNFAVNEGYEDFLAEILDCHQQESPISHIKKFELIKGDASKTIKCFLENNPEIIISLVYFDFDLYKPTKDCLEAILPYCTRGTILAFDELNCKDFPGETIAVREVLDLTRYRLERDIYNPRCSFIEL